MGLFSQRKQVGAVRLAFRWCRITLLFVIFLVVVGLAYLHLVGLPEFLKPPLLEKIQNRGFEARFTSARLGWGPAIIIENAAFSPTNRVSGPRLSAGMTEVKLNWNALLHGHLRADSVEVLNGEVRIPVSQRYGKTLSLDGVHLKMRLFSNDVAQLSDCGALFRGIRIRIDGVVTNFGWMGSWKLPARWQPQPGQPTPGQPAANINILEQLHFGKNTRLDLHLSADGRDINTLRAEAMFESPVVETPWGNAGGIQLRAAAAHLLDFTNRPFMQARVTAGSITNRWGTCGNVSLTAAFFPDSATPFNAMLNIAVDNPEAQWNLPSGAAWARASRLEWEGEAALSPATFKPAALEGNLRVVRADSWWGSAGALSLGLKADRLETPPPADTNWGIWTRFSPYSCACHIAATNLQSPQLRFESLALDVMWRAPQLAVEKLEGRLYEGQLSGDADLNIQSRQLRVRAASDFDPHGISKVLTPAAQRWIGEFGWQKPPAVNAEIRLVLPAWTNRTEGWGSDLRASVQIAGDFSVGAASFRGIGVTSARARLFYTNRVWNVPRLYATRTNGSVEVEYTGNDATHEYNLLFDSRMEPSVALPWLEPEQRRLLSEVHFSSPPEIHAEAHGLWHDPGSLAFTGTVLATNFAVHGEPFDDVRAGVQYTKRLLRVSGLRLSQGTGRLEVPLVTADFESRGIVVTNAQSTLDPQMLVKGMGSNAPDFLRIVRFDAAPNVKASGSLVLGDPQATDMRFEIHGEHFHWTDLGADQISGRVHWLGRNVFLTNIDARLYNSGRLSGWLAFDSAPGRRDGFRSDFTAKDIDLGLLARSLTGKSSRVEGMLDGYMALNAPVSANKATWTGHGDIHIHDALLWDIKILGFLSPLLNAISPGLGDSRARQASAVFSIGGGKVSSDDLEIHSTGVRLLYHGSITMNKEVNGRVEADVLRDTPLFGPFLSVVLSPLSKLFEYQITGPLRKPEIKPLYVPKFLMFFARPSHTTKNAEPEPPPTAPPKQGP